MKQFEVDERFHREALAEHRARKLEVRITRILPPSPCLCVVVAMKRACTNGSKCTSMMTSFAADIPCLVGWLLLKRWRESSTST